MLVCRTCRCTRSSFKTEDRLFLPWALRLGSFAATAVPRRRPMMTTPKPPRPSTRSGVKRRSAGSISQCSCAPTSATLWSMADRGRSLSSDRPRSRPVKTLPVFVVLATLCGSDLGSNIKSNKPESDMISGQMGSRLEGPSSAAVPVAMLRTWTRYLGSLQPASATDSRSTHSPHSLDDVASMDCAVCEADASRTARAKLARSSSARRPGKARPQTDCPKHLWPKSSCETAKLASKTKTSAPSPPRMDCKARNVSTQTSKSNRGSPCPRTASHSSRARRSWRRATKSCMQHRSASIDVMLNEVHVRDGWKDRSST
mmetsp:Transcript_47688/g.138951  ORF Transcript_47688/g.138951 Transcript_47688/m.138951 type:complete len:315 (+) Transcript_47688:1122-2066(+)